MPEPANFEEALAELDRILRTLEDGTTLLDEALARYERGVGLLKGCYAQLQAAELRIQQLTPSEDGPPELRPFAHMAAYEGGSVAPKRRASPGAAPRVADESAQGEIPF